MAINPSLDNASGAGKPRLRKSLKLWQVVMMGLAYLTPMTVFDTFGIVSGISNGHVPASYLLALAGVLFTAISYGKLVRQFPQAGSAYTYAQKSISPHVGFMVGWSSLLDYLFLPMINVLLAKIYLSALFPDVPPWVWVVTFVAILTAANLKSVNLVANFNTLFVLVQISIMVVFIVHRLVAAALYQPECAPDPDYYRGDDRLLFIPRLRCGDYAFRRDAGRRAGDPEGDLSDRGLWRSDFHCRFVLYAALFPRYQPF